MGWFSVIKLGEMGSRKTFNDYDKARRLAFQWSFAVPHVIREKDGKFTVMMKRDTFRANDYGPVVFLQTVRGR